MSTPSEPTFEKRETTWEGALLWLLDRSGKSVHVSVEVDMGDHDASPFGTAGVLRAHPDVWAFSGMTTESGKLSGGHFSLSDEDGRTVAEIDLSELRHCRFWQQDALKRLLVHPVEDDGVALEFVEQVPLPGYERENAERRHRGTRLPQRKAARSAVRVLHRLLPRRRQHRLRCGRRGRVRHCRLDSGCKPAGGRGDEAVRDLRRGETRLRPRQGPVEQVTLFFASAATAPSGRARRSARSAARSFPLTGRT